MGLEVNVDVVAAALQISGCCWTVTVTMSVPAVWNKWCSLLMSPMQLPAVQDNPFHYEDCEEASSYDELWKREAGLFETKTGIRVLNFSVAVKNSINNNKKTTINVKHFAVKLVCGWTYLHLSSIQLCVDV